MELRLLGVCLESEQCPEKKLMGSGRVGLIVSAQRAWPACSIGWPTYLGPRPPKSGLPAHLRNNNQRFLPEGGAFSHTSSVFTLSQMNDGGSEKDVTTVAWIVLGLDLNTWLSSVPSLQAGSYRGVEGDGKKCDCGPGRS